MARKKIVFVIVEGPSDEEALGVLLTRIFEKESVYVHINHGDITSKSRVNPSNIANQIENCIREYEKKNHFKRSDFKEIIHIIDTDGAFVKDGVIIEDQQAKKTIYSPSEIRTMNPHNIIDRNKRKRENILRLIMKDEICNIPYSIYYMSCNLDHALYNKLNSSDDEKEEDAYKFAKKYSKNIPAFIKFIQESDFVVKSDYRESWDYIQKDLHSLERHTNFGLCFPDDYQD